MLKKRKQPETAGRSGEEEKYQFMREQIRPQRKRIIMGFLLKALGIVVLAVIFGSIAGSTFIFMQNMMEAGTESQAREALLQSTTDVEATQEPEVEEFSGREPLAYYQAFWKEVASVGNRCNQSLVKISRKQGEGGFRKSGETDNVQSGIIFQESKKCYYILTSASRWLETKSAEAEISNGEVVTAKMTGMDEALEIAVLTIEKKNISKEGKRGLRVAEFGGKTGFGIGFPVVAIGSPNGVMKSVISGRIVNDDLTGEITDGEVALYSSDIEYCEDGDGFVADMQGQIIGIITNSYQNVTGKTGCAFMEISQIRNLVSCLAKGKKMTYFGVTGCDYADRKDLKMEDGEGGIYVNSVIPQSPAYRGGLRVVDVITEINGQRIRNLQELRGCLLSYESGAKIQVTVSRHSGSTQSEKCLEVVLEKAG